MTPSCCCAAPIVQLRCHLANSAREKSHAVPLEFVGRSRKRGRRGIISAVSSSSHPGGNCSHRRSVALGIGAVAALLWLTVAGAKEEHHSAQSAGCGKHAGTGKLKLSTLDGNR